MTDQTAKVLTVMPEAEARVALTPMDMLDRAVSQGASIEVMEKLMALHERWEANQARKAFDEAIAAAKAKIKPIVKNRTVGFKSKKIGASDTNYKHEDLAEIARTVDPILGEHGLSYRFRSTSVVNEPITVTCIISHRLGHSEENTLSAGRDDSGNKNSIQAIGSTVTYLQRYTLKSALGLAASNDDDGEGSEPAEVITAEQATELSDLILKSRTDIAKFLTWAKVESIPDIQARFFDSCKQVLQDRLNMNAKPKGAAS